MAEVWRHGSVVGSWLVDLTADALARLPELAQYSGRVSDSGEGRWTVEAAINESVPAPVISAALWQRFESRGEGEFTAKVLSAMRAGFGGHVEKSRRSAPTSFRSSRTPTAVAAAAATYVANRARTVRGSRRRPSRSP